MGKYSFNERNTEIKSQPKTHSLCSVSAMCLFKKLKITAQNLRAERDPPCRLTEGQVRLIELIFREQLSQTVRAARLTTPKRQINALIMSHISSISCFPMKKITLYSDIQQNFRNLGD